MIAPVQPHTCQPTRLVSSRPGPGAAREIAKAVEDEGIQLSIGIGLNSGKVLAGNVGGGGRLEFAVIGDPVNVAARLQATAGPGQILVDEATRAAVDGTVLTQDLGNVRLAGKGDWVPVFSVLAQRARGGS